MLAHPTPLKLVDAQTGEFAFQLGPIDAEHRFDHLQRNNFYTVLFLQAGQGRYKADFSTYEFAAGCLLFFTPYQPFMLLDSEGIIGMSLHFHADFFCIEQHKKEVACNGVLFNNIYQPPSVQLGSLQDIQSFQGLFDQMQEEISKPELAQYELLIAYLKIFLINASRLKVAQYTEALTELTAEKPLLLQQLKAHIEQHFNRKHYPADYAEMLHLSVDALGKLVRNNFNKTLTELIQERIVIEAKRDLYLTNKTVKEIAFNLGFEDEYYFSRMFKKNTDISPALYRQSVGFGRGANLSIY